MYAYGISACFLIVYYLSCVEISHLQELDAVAVPLRDDFGEKHPKIHPIPLDLEEYKDIEKWNGYYITLIGHAYGLPLSRAIAFVTENFGENTCNLSSHNTPALLCTCLYSEGLYMFMCMKGLTVMASVNK